MITQLYVYAIIDTDELVTIPKAPPVGSEDKVLTLKINSDDCLDLERLYVMYIGEL